MGSFSGSPCGRESQSLLFAHIFCAHYCLVMTFFGRGIRQIWHVIPIFIIFGHHVASDITHRFAWSRWRVCLYGLYKTPYARGYTKHCMRVCRLARIAMHSFAIWGMRQRLFSHLQKVERGSMFQILKKTQFSEKVFEFRVHAPRMAKKAHAGQFLMVRIDETASACRSHSPTGTLRRAGSSSSSW